MNDFDHLNATSLLSGPKPNMTIKGSAKFDVLSHLWDKMYAARIRQLGIGIMLQLAPWENALQNNNILFLDNLVSANMEVYIKICMVVQKYICENMFYYF